LRENKILINEFFEYLIKNHYFADDDIEKLRNLIEERIKNDQ